VKQECTLTDDRGDKSWEFSKSNSQHADTGEDGRSPFPWTWSYPWPHPIQSTCIHPVW